MSFTKITTTELNSRGATTLPNQPAMSATTLKQEFDAPAKNIVAPKFNNLVDELEATTAAASLGAVAPTGRIGNNVQGVMNSISSDLDTLAANTSTAIAEAHAHPNKALLDDYTQTEADLADAVLQKHAHPNKAVIDKFADDGTRLTYDGNPVGAVTSVNSQTGAVVLTASDVGALPSTTAIPTKTSDLTNDSGFITSGDIPTIPTKTSDLTNDSNFVADASYVHTDNNYDATAKTIVDGATAAIAAKSTVAWNQIDTTGTKIAEITIDGVKTDVKATGGGGSADAYKTIDAGGQSFVASGADTFKINAGSNVTITPLTGDKGIQISAAGGGTSTGDMLMSDYDPSGTVKSSANGITGYVANAISGKADTSSLATVATSGSYNDLDDKLTQGTGIAINNNVIAVDADNTPTAGSEKPVKSKGVHSALEANREESASLLKSTVGWTGKNLCPFPTNGNRTESGVTFTVNSDGSISLSGTATAHIVYTVDSVTGVYKNKVNINLVDGKKYKLTGCPANGGDNKYTLALRNGTANPFASDIGNGVEYTHVNTNNDISVIIRIFNGQNCDNLTFYPMLRDASITDDTYEPYHESVETMYEEEIHGVNLLKNEATTQTINGVTFTVNSDESVRVVANNTSVYSALTLNSNLAEILEVGQSYVLTGTPIKPSGTSYRQYELRIRKNSNNDVVASDTGSGVEFTITQAMAQADTYRLDIAIFDGTTCDTVFKPMIRKAEIDDPTYRPYNEQAIQNQINAQGVLGAKNLLPNNATSQTKNGVTFTVNSDGTVTINGTSTAATDLKLFESTTFKGDLILSSGGFTGSAHYIFVNAYNGTTYVKTIMRTLEGDNARGIIDYNGYTNIAVKLNIASGQTFNNFIVKPMIRLASDPDDTYVPYAMTNRELTEKSFLSKRVLTSSDDLNNIKDVGFYAISSSPTNAPESIAYCNLTVYPTGASLDGKGGLIQMILWRGAMYVRGYTGNPLSWTNWIKYAGTELT